MSEPACPVVLYGTTPCRCQQRKPSVSDVSMWATGARWHERQEDGELVEIIAAIKQVACAECRIWYRAFEGEPSTCPCCAARAELKALRESR